MNIATLALAVTTAKAIRALGGEFVVIAANSEIRANLVEFGEDHLRFIDRVDELMSSISPNNEKSR